MAKIFNVNGACKPNRHYMVDLGSRLKAIRVMVDNGEFFFSTEPGNMAKRLY